MATSEEKLQFRDFTDCMRPEAIVWTHYRLHQTGSYSLETLQATADEKLQLRHFIGYIGRETLIWRLYWLHEDPKLQFGDYIGYIRPEAIDQRLYRLQQTRNYSWRLYRLHHTSHYSLETLQTTSDPNVQFGDFTRETKVWRLYVISDVELQFEDYMLHQS